MGSKVIAKLGTMGSKVIAKASALICRACRLITVLAVVSVCWIPSVSYADGGVTLVGAWAGSRGIHDVWPGPTESYNLTLEFDKNVSWPDRGNDAFVRENLAKVYVLDESGRRVDGIVAEGASGPDDKTIIYVRATEWLAPLANYTVVAEAGIRAKNGEDATAVEYRAPFKTGADCANGLTVYQNVAISVLLLAAIVGAAAAFLRRRRAR